MGNLNKIKQSILKNKQEINDYKIPDIWNLWGYENFNQSSTEGEIEVNPYDFYSSLIDYILDTKEADVNYNLPLSKLFGTKNRENYVPGNWLKDSVLYSTMIRTSASWDHTGTGELETENSYHLKDTGTFIKHLALLPLLKKMGVDIVYMLPISKYSLKNKKGELGSAYGVSSFFELDPLLKDPITKNDTDVNDEFKAFVEACHILGMKVMIDIIPRTNAVENDLIVEHPDWFYWIESKDLEIYKPPYVDGIGNTLSPTKELLETCFKTEEYKKHIGLFRKNPYEVDPGKWTLLQSDYREGKGELLDLIDKHYGLTIAPAFSDHINDPQPPWTDITFFRMYLDHPRETQNFLEDRNTAPYILPDTIKSNLFPGMNVNVDLWKKLSNIIPHYQKSFGIDGARIDMGHALPLDLTDSIIKTARQFDEDFAFIAEELQPSNAAAAQDAGYNMIIGNGFWMEHRIKEGKLEEFITSSRHLPIPTFACAETHDTARATARDGGKLHNRLLTCLNMFMPNGIPFINSGQEIYEAQPMNLGLDCREDEHLRISKDDPYYGKLALFDKYAFHYTNPDRMELPNLLEKLSKIRKENSFITDKSTFLPIKNDNKSVLTYSFKSNSHYLIIIANVDYENKQVSSISKLGMGFKDEELLFSINEKSSVDLESFELEPGEFAIIKA